MGNCKGFVIPKAGVEVLSILYSVEYVDGEVIFPYIEGKTVLDQMLEAGAVIEA